MTLVAAWMEDGCPLLAGDFLISASDIGDAPHMNIATYDNLNSALPRDWGVRIAGSRQKVCILSDNVAVGWTGTQVVASAVIRDLRQAVESGQATLEEVRKALAENESASSSVSCELIGWVIEEGNAVCFLWDATHPEDIRTGPGFLGGSGADAFEEAFRTGAQGGTQDPIRHALSVLGQLLGQEVVFGINLRSLFGGGFQLITLRNGKFEVVPSITWVFLVGVTDGETVEYEPVPRLIKMHYQDQVMRIDIPSSKDRENYDVFLMSTVDAEPLVLKTPVKPLSISSDYYCVFFHVQVTGRGACEFALVESHATGGSIVKVDTTATGEALALSDKAFEAVNKFLDAVLNKSEDGK